jgi:hypothetical protein
MIFMILKFRDSVEICLIFVCIHLQVYFLSKMLARNMPPCETTKFGASGLLPRKHRGGTMRLLGFVATQSFGMIFAQLFTAFAVAYPDGAGTCYISYVMRSSALLTT